MRQHNGAAAAACAASTAAAAAVGDPAARRGAVCEGGAGDGGVDTVPCGAVNIHSRIKHSFVKQERRYMRGCRHSCRHSCCANRLSNRRGWFGVWEGIARPSRGRQPSRRADGAPCSPPPLSALHPTNCESSTSSATSLGSEKRAPGSIATAPPKPRGAELFENTCGEGGAAGASSSLCSAAGRRRGRRVSAPGSDRSLVLTARSRRMSTSTSCAAAQRGQKVPWKPSS